MTWLILDLARQVREVLRPRHGGTGNANAWARGWLFDGYNGTGSTIDLHTLVKYTGIANFVTPTTAAGETGVLGVVVGYLNGDGSLVEDDCPTGGPVAVLMAGVVPVVVDSTVDRGDYAFASGTAGEAASDPSSGAGVFGQFLEAATAGYPALVRLFGTGAAAGMAHDDLTGVTTDQHHDEVHDADGGEHTFPGGTTTFLRGDGVFASPGASGAGGSAKGWVGDGSDGTVAMDGVNTFAAFASLAGSIYTLTRDIVADTLTISSGVTLRTDRFKVLVKGALTVDGTIVTGVNGGGAAASGATGGTVTSLNKPIGRGAPGANGRTNSAGVGGNGTADTNTSGGGAGGGGGAATSGGGTGGATAVAAFYTTWRALPWAAMGMLFGIETVKFVNGGGGGGAGGSASSTTTVSGGGGAGGGIIIIAAQNITIGASGLIHCDGGAGGNASGTGAAGGGGGGGGGVVILIYEVLTNSGTVRAAGGAKGTGNGAGANGVDGSNGTVLQIAMA